MLNRDRPRSLVATLALLTALGVSSRAHAASEQDRRAAGDELTQARDLKQKGQLAEALPHFQESQRLDPKLVTLLELAECEEQLGQLVDAQAHFAAARDQAKHDEKPQSRQRAEQHLAAIDKRVAHLTLTLAADAPAGTQVFRDDAPVDAASLGTAQPSAPGDHIVVVKAPGHDDAKYPIKLAEGDNQTVPVTAGPATAAPPPPPPPPKPAPVAAVSTQDLASSGSGSTQRTLGIVAGSVGIVGLAGGGALWYVGYRDSNSLGPTAGQQLLLGQISVIAGGALLVTGIVLLATAPSAGPPKNARLRVTPTLSVGQNATVLGAAGEF
jgi:hypothetical protein